MKKKIIIAGFYLFIVSCLFAMPAHPKKQDGLLHTKGKASEIFRKSSTRLHPLDPPQKILVLRAEFTDVKFQDEAIAADGMLHDKAYFERVMYHMKTFFKNASHGQYTFDYTILDSIINLDNTMGYYGNDAEWSNRVVEFTRDTIEKADPYVDFSEYTYQYRGTNYAAVVIFHAGAGQESDTTGNNTDELWSTFLTLSDLKEVLDPNNDSYEGIPTNDGVFVAESSICPESQKQPDADDGTANYGILGVVAHELGHQIGLPTLFDNDSSNGKSAGIGNFGIMGTGAWNANGHVPPLPCAWSRYYMGWEEPIVINKNANDNFISYTMAENGIPKTYRINISDKEYFLVEYRSQNPDGSTLNGFPNFTFPLLPEGEQDYYEDYPNVPVFNFMENSYDGAEWDFFFPGPGYGEPPTVDDDGNELIIDGSGLFIWHIDEHVILNNLSENLDTNSINGDATHRGVDLEEADGRQHMDSYMSHQYMFGGPYDSFRPNHNEYFGYETYIDEESGEEYYSNPTSASYYGAPSVEIKNIQYYTEGGFEGKEVMTFDVSYDWYVRENYEGENPFGPFVKSEDDGDIIIYPNPNGIVGGWKEREDLPNFPIDLNAEITTLYSVDLNHNLWIPICRDGQDKIAILSLDGSIEEINLAEDYKFMKPINFIVYEENEGDYIGGFFLYNEAEDQSRIYGIERNKDIVELETLDGKITSNLYFSYSPENSIYAYTVNDEQYIQDEKIDLDPENDPIELIFSESHFKAKNKIYKRNDNDQYALIRTVAQGSSELISLNQADDYSQLEYLVGEPNKFSLFNNSFEYETTNLGNDITALDSIQAIAPTVFYSETIGSNVIAQITAGKRLTLWENPNSTNHFEMVQGFPKIQRYQSRTQPVASSKAIYVGTDNGRVVRYPFAVDEQLMRQEYAYTEYYNYQRSNLLLSSYLDDMPTPAMVSKFDRENTYVFPNPYTKFTHGGTIETRITLSKDSVVEARLYDIAGNIIFEDKKECFANIHNNNRIELPVSKLSSGVYILILESDNDLYSQKIMIEK